LVKNRLHFFLGKSFAKGKSAVVPVRAEKPGRKETYGLAVTSLSRFSRSADSMPNGVAIQGFAVAFKPIPGVAPVPMTFRFLPEVSQEQQADFLLLNVYRSASQTVISSGVRSVLNRIRTFSSGRFRKGPDSERRKVPAQRREGVYFAL